MKQLLRAFLFFVFIASLLTACQKEISYENGAGGGIVIPPPATTGTAEFNLTGAPGECATPVIKGTYKQGIATGDTNNITVQVNVTDTGSYNIVSSTVNNVKFSATGTFLATGTQTLVFKATGIPAAAGSFVFTLGTGGCTFTISILPGAVVPPPPPPVAGDCKECAYVPVCVGIKYEFSDIVAGNTALRFIELMSSADTVMSGKSFKKITDNSGQASYYNCTNGETTVAGFQLATANGNTVEKFESIMLKANAAVGATWQSDVTNPLGQTIIQKFKISAKGISLTAGGFSFNDVIKVNLETGMDLPGVGFFTASLSDYYYAKGVGLVLMVTTDPTGTQEMYRSEIKSYFIP